MFFLLAQYGIMYFFETKRFIMPKPLIILEQHLGTGARSFISENAGSLEALGYSKFLFEMNSELSHQQLKQELQMILKMHGNML